MRATVPICVAVIAFQGSLFHAHAANTYVIDLSQNQGEEVTHSISSARSTTELKVLIDNKVPMAQYSVLTDIRNAPIPKLDAGVFTGGAPGMGLEALDPDDGCEKKVRPEVEKLLKTDDESAVSPLRTAIRDGLNSLDAEARKECRSRLNVDALFADTRQDLGTVSLKRGQELHVTISRVKEGKSLSWKHVFKTPRRGSWHTSYGFVFIPNEDEEFFTEAEGDGTDGFVIQAKREDKDLDLAPSVFFTWMPGRKELSNHSWSLAAGLGFDLDDPIVFLGGGWTYNQNVSLLAGIVAHKQKRLLGRYDEGQKLKVDLEESQLHEESYSPNYFVGVSFRFGSSPWARGEAQTEEKKKIEPAKEEKKEEEQGDSDTGA